MCVFRSGNVTLEDLERAKQELSTAQEELSATKQRVQTLESEKGQVVSERHGHPLPLHVITRTCTHKRVGRARMTPGLKRCMRLHV